MDRLCSFGRIKKPGIDRSWRNYLHDHGRMVG